MATMDEDFARWELELAFTWHVVHQILAADGEVTEAERAFVAGQLPAGRLGEAGFLQGGAFTDRFRAALGEALLQLPTLPKDERAGIVRTLYRAAVADASLARSEADTVQRAARLLGLREAEYREVLDPVVASEGAPAGGEEGA